MDRVDLGTLIVSVLAVLSVVGAVALVRGTFGKKKP